MPALAARKPLLRPGNNIMDIREAMLRNRLQSERHPWELARHEVIAELLREFSPSIHKPGSVFLDIGCGDAFLSKHFAVQYPANRFIAVDRAFNRETMKTYGIAPRPSNLSFLRELSEIDPETTPVDTVLLLDLLEHVENDVRFLQELVSSPFIAEAATFIITVPAFESLFCAQDRFLGHFRRYNIHQLRRAAVTAGLVVCDLGYFFASLLVLRRIEVFLEKRSLTSIKEGTGLTRWKGSPGLTRILKQLLFYDASVGRFLNKCGIRIPGLSCYLICRKRVS